MSTNATTAKTLTDEQFDLRLQQIDDQAAAMQERVNAFRDQELARLFHQCGWTQQRIADKVGKSQNWVCYQLRFGAFLEFITSGDNSTKPPKNLTERKFRGYYERTTEEKEDLRFADVLKLMEEESYLELVPKGRRDPEVSELILDQFADGKWHYLETIVKGVGKPEEAVKTRLRFMRERGTKGVFCESRKAGRSTQYRIVKGRANPKRIIVDALKQELGPLLDELRCEGKKHVAERSNARIMQLVYDIEKLIDRMAK